jgi:TatD DNase family protein
MDLDTSKYSLRLAEEHQGLVYAALGIHPWNTSQLPPSELEQTIDFIQQNAANKKVVAIGEVGLDPQYAKRKEQKELQTKVFHEMLRLAEKLTLPVIVHSRWSAEKILEILALYRLRGVLWHWFSGATDLLPKIIERGDYISEGPPTVFSDRIQAVVRLVPLERLLTETDGPVRYYGPFKDKLTTPAFIPEVVKTIGEIKRVKESEVAEQIYRNFVNFTQIGL